MIKNISGQANKLVDALKRKILVVQECKIQNLGFEFMNKIYAQEADFKKPLKLARAPYTMTKVSGNNL